MATESKELSIQDLIDSPLGDKALAVSELHDKLIKAIETARQAINEVSSVSGDRHKAIEEYNLSRFVLLANNWRDKGLTWCVGCQLPRPSQDFKPVQIKGAGSDCGGYDEHPGGIHICVRICPDCYPDRIKSKNMKHGNFTITNITSISDDTPTIDFGSNEWLDLYKDEREWLSPYISRQIQDEWQIPNAIHKPMSHPNHNSRIDDVRIIISRAY